MANKVISFKKGQDNKQKTSNVDNEVYIDISTVAGMNFHPKPKLQTEDELYAFLMTEHGTPEYAYAYICSEESKEYSEESKEYLRLQYAHQEDYERAIRLWLKFEKYTISKLVNVNAIRNSIHQIFTWIPGERILNPEFGSNLRRLLYEGITQFNVEQIMAEIRRSVSQWEPRVLIVRVVDMGTVDDTEDNTVHIEVQYTIPGLTEELIYSEPIIYSQI